MSASTVVFPFMTRETVACETPAMDATSAMPTRRVYLLPGMVSFLELPPHCSAAAGHVL
jgi:biotin synthase-related radical SAM superfamily protein